MKFSGVIGFYKEDVETSPGIYNNVIVERPYKGDVYNPNYRFQNTSYQNDRLILENRISVISDIFLQKNLESIRYVVWKGTKWEVSSVDLNSYPRAILNIGGVYNDNEGTETSSPEPTE